MKIEYIEYPKREYPLAAIILDCAGLLVFALAVVAFFILL